MIDTRLKTMKTKKRVLIAVAALCLFFIVFQISVSSTSRFLNDAAFPAKSSTRGEYEVKAFPLISFHLMKLPNVLVSLFFRRNSFQFQLYACRQLAFGNGIDYGTNF